MGRKSKGRNLDEKNFKKRMHIIIIQIITKSCSFNDGVNDDELNICQRNHKYII